MGLVLLPLGFVYTLEKTDLWVVPTELGCVFFVLMNVNVKNWEENNIGFFISVMHVTVFNPELYFDEHNGLSNTNLHWLSSVLLGGKFAWKLTH